MVLRRIGAALIQTSGGFRRVRGMRDMPKPYLLKAAKNLLKVR